MKRNILDKLYRTGFFHIFGTNVLNKILGFVNGIILVRVLTKPEYGLFTYAFNIYNLIMLANGLGMDASVLQLCCERIQDKAFCQRVVRQGARIGGAFNIFLGIILLGLGLFVPLAFEASRPLFYMLCLLPLTQFIYALLCIILRAERRNQEFAQLSLISTLVTVSMGITFAWFFREKGLIVGYYLASLAGIGWGYLRLSTRIHFRGETLEPESRKSLISIGTICVLNNGISQMLYVLDIFILGIFFSDESILAGYKVATLIPFGLLFIPSSLMTYLFPYFASHQQDGKWCYRYYLKILCGFGLANAVLSAVLFLFADLVVQVAFGRDYADIVPLFQILLVNYFFTATFRNLAGNVLAAQRKLKFNFYVAATSGVLNIVLDICFIQWWGAWGAAVTTFTVTVFSGVVSTIYLIYVFKKTVSCQ